MNVKNNEICLLESRGIRTYAVVLVYVVLIGIFMITAPKAFLDYKIYMAFLSTIPFSLVIALGLTFVIMAGEIDLSFPSVMAFSGFIFTYIFIYTGSTILAFVVSLAAGSVAGFLNGTIVAKVKIPSILMRLDNLYCIKFLLAG